MKTEKQLYRIGKYMSLLLRHMPEKENLDIDKFGYVAVKQLIKKLDISKEDLDWIVNNNNKKRYSYNNKETKIRANQGHSIDVNIEMDEVTDIDELFHGTITKHLNSITKDGLLKMNRQHVHLSGDKDTAINVGNRHVRNYRDELMLLVINIKKMREDGHKIYKSANGVYLTEHIPPKYIFITFKDNKI